MSSMHQRQVSRRRWSWCLLYDERFKWQMEAKERACLFLSSTNSDVSVSKEVLWLCSMVQWRHYSGTNWSRASIHEYIIDDVKHFFIYGVLPEIVGKWYTRKPVANKEGVVPMPQSTLDTAEDIDSEDYEKPGVIVINSVMVKWFAVTTSLAQ